MAHTEELLIDTEIVQMISNEQAWHYRITPKAFNESAWHFYIDESTYDEGIHQELEMLLGQSVSLELVPAEQINRSLLTYYRRENEAAQQRAKVYEGESEDFLLNLITDAKDLKSSDIHIESYEEKCRVRFRIDGMMVERYKITKDDYPSLVNKIKILANLDIAEKRLPQDGRIVFNRYESKFDIRVSVLPTLYGEKVVLRLLNNDATNIDLYKLGISEFDLTNYLEGIRKPNGIVLISGPTGSGKTTTLYATLKLLNLETRNILTIEDPIEYTLEGVNQVQLKESIGFNFGSALRTFLRQDPDVIMVGEIRDPDTANMAIRASLTGHLVLSTIHTNSAWGTVSRLIDMGIPPFLVANTLSTTVAQRLVRLLCTHCRACIPFDKKLYPKQFSPYSQVTEHYIAKGCNHCFHTGYKGRKAVYEVIPVDMELGDKIKNAIFDISDLLKARGIKTLSQNAFELFEKGETSLEEIYPLLINF